MRVGFALSSRAAPGFEHVKPSCLKRVAHKLFNLKCRNPIVLPDAPCCQSVRALLLEGTLVYTLSLNGAPANGARILENVGLPPLI